MTIALCGNVADKTLRGAHTQKYDIPSLSLNFSFRTTTNSPSIAVGESAAYSGALYTSKREIFTSAHNSQNRQPYQARECRLQRSLQEPLHTAEEYTAPSSRLSRLTWHEPLPILKIPKFCACAHMSVNLCMVVQYKNFNLWTLSRLFLDQLWRAMQITARQGKRSFPSLTDCSTRIISNLNLSVLHEGTRMQSVLRPPKKSGKESR